MSNETSQETWNATHAQLLKSVADAQARLLAAENEISDKLTAQAKEIVGVNETLHRVRDRLDTFKRRLDSLDLQFIANQNTMLSGKLDAIGALLAELLQAKSYRTQPKSKRKRHG